MSLLLKLAGGLVVAWIAVVGLLALAQDWLLFPRWAVPEGGDLPADAREMTVALPSGGSLVGVHLPPADAQGGTTLLLGFGGNAWSAEGVALFLRTLFPDRHVVAFHYRGYGPSAGRPSAAALLEDAVRVHDHAVAALAPGRVIAVGLSLGSGPAAYLGQQRPVDGLVLVTPFDDLEALARHHYPWMPVRWLLRHRLDIAGALAGSAVPVALIAAEHDTVVPAARTKPLRDAARTLVLDRVVPGAGHNDLYDTRALAAALREAVVLIEEGS